MGTIRPRRAARVAMAVAATISATLLTAAPSSTADPGPCNSRPYAVAKTNWDDGYIGKQSYQLRVTSYLHRCEGGYVEARHYVLLKSGHVQELGAEVRINIGTRRSDGKWWGQGNTTLASSKNTSAASFRQIRGVGGGLDVTHVRITHIAKEGQTNFPIPEEATARYKPWHGPEATGRTDY
jgi:hypothetical protein